MWTLSFPGWSFGTSHDELSRLKFLAWTEVHPAEAVHSMAPKATKVVVITGATRGLGRAMAERFMEAGHTVLGCGRGHAEIARLTRKYLKPHNFSTVDVSRDEQVQDWAKRLLAEYGPPDLLLNNAALI